jgi:hypothetical protein
MKHQNPIVILHEPRGESRGSSLTLAQMKAYMRLFRFLPAEAELKTIAHRSFKLSLWRRTDAGFRTLQERTHHE